MIKIVMFDIGGVIIRVPSELHYAYLSRISGVSKARAKKVIFTYVPRLELGRMSLKAFEESVAKDLGIERSEVHWLEFLKENAAVNTDVEDLMDALREEYRLAYLTNTDYSRYGYTFKILDNYSFDYRFASCYLHKRKPDPEIYRYVTRKMGVKPEEVVFIDNEYPNVVGARSVGCSSVWFRGRRELDKALARLDL